MVVLEKVLAELKSEGLNEVEGHGNYCLVESNNYCLVGSNNFCLFSYTQSESDTPSETPSQPDDQNQIQGLGNQCIV